jgi:hypothetical protein
MRKKALLVGIDNYPGTGNDLDSCVNDIAAWRTLLMESYGFARTNIRLLANSRATKPAVLERLAWLLQDSVPGDSLVFAYSGHGTTGTQRDRFDNLAEARDQALCLYGHLDWDSFLVDDELFTMLLGVPEGVKLTVICDSCFSGGMDKVLTPLLAQGGVSNKYLPLPIDLAHRDDPYAPVRSFGQALPKELVPQPTPDATAPLHCLLLAACRDNEPAAAARPETRGLSLFSYMAIRTLRASATPLAAAELVNSVGQQIYNCGYPQVPQIKGPTALLAAPLF